MFGQFGDHPDPSPCRCSEGMAEALGLEIDTEAFQVESWMRGSRCDVVPPGGVHSGIQQRIGFSDVFL